MIAPRHFLDAVYGDRAAYSGFAHPAVRRWLPADPVALAAMSGSQLAVGGDLPMLCHAAAASEPGLDLLREAGLPVASRLHRYTDLAGYQRALDGLLADGRRLVVQHRHPADCLPDAHCWVSPDLLATLNDKAGLADLVPPHLCPSRRVFTPDQPDWSPPGGGLPYLLKAATRHSTGGGVDVVVCRDAASLAAAKALLRHSERVVAEDWLDFSHAFCLNYLAWPDGRVDYLGAAEMPVSADGRYQGNWLGAGPAPPASACESGRAIAAAGAARGFHGLLGMDVALLRDGGARIFDLNFRLCGSTGPLLLFDAAAARHGAAVARYRGWRFRGDFAAMLASARAWVRAGRLLPLGLADPALAGHPGEPAQVNGLLLGATREDVAGVERAMQREGWD